uniref:Nuclear factor-Y subunit B2 n=2 Tax=Schmidtea mediterranea TaxID=79327 RepID=A0A182BAE3_SCHMD|nr:nuclear factor-Y subunit B2 [Schmidtea mediterranea]
MDSNQENIVSDNNFDSYYENMDHQVQQGDGEYTQEFEQLSPLREQDRFLPIANVSKIMKKAVPTNGKISKEAKEIVQECVSEYISFITSEAAEKCQQEKRKTINGEDLLWAMANLGFEQSVEPLRLFLTKYREANKLDSSIMDDSIEMGRHMDNNMGNVENTIYLRDNIEYVQSEAGHDSTTATGTITLSTDGSSSGNIYVTYPTNLNTINGCNNNVDNSNL